MMTEAPAASEITVGEFLAEREPNVQIVDVRETDEWAEGRMPGAVLIPLGDVLVRSGELDPSRPIVTVCRSGRRSLAAAEALMESGFGDVRSLAGGMIAWAEAGQPVER